MIYYILAAFAGAILALSIYIILRKSMLKGRKEENIRKKDIEAENNKKKKKIQQNEK